MIHDTLGERIFLQLKEDILLGYYKPGERLLYHDIAKRLETSVSPIKEALVKLVEANLAESIPRKGTFVAKLTKTDIIEYAQLRLALECLAIELAIEKGFEDSDIEELFAINESLKQLIENQDSQNATKKDLDFHNKIIEMSKNGRLSKTFHQIVINSLFIMAKDHDFLKENGETVYELHKKIINAIKVKDVENTKKYLRENTLEVYLNDNF